MLKFDDKNGFKAHLSYGTQEKEYNQTAWKNTGAESCFHLWQL